MYCTDASCVVRGIRGVGPIRRITRQEEAVRISPYRLDRTVVGHILPGKQPVHADHPTRVEVQEVCIIEGFALSEWHTSARIR